ncbi:MAG: hypothetical protein V1750_01750 [Acidobacteriota bacterium]
MRRQRLRTSFVMGVRSLLRARLVLLLVLLIPAVFILLTLLTTQATPILFKLAAIAGEPFVEVRQRDQALVYIAQAAIGLIAAFVGLALSQRDAEAHRRLLLCGYRIGELLTARLVLLAAVVALTGAYGLALVRLLAAPRSLLGTFLGFAAIGYVYASFGVLVGALVRRELEGILLVVLLVNIDVGWLQNPLFYAEAQNQAIIRWLPAFHPTQLTMIAAFTDHGILRALLGSIAWGSAFLLIALAASSWRDRIGRARPRAAGSGGEDARS